MKVEAYRCDCCGYVKEESEMTGIMPVEDMFDRMKSFPICTNPTKTTVHFCLSCYQRNVIEKVRTVDRKKDERLYELKLNELQYALRSTCVTNVRNRKKFVLSI
jgi:hypothetical protein